MPEEQLPYPISPKARRLDIGEFSGRLSSFLDRISGDISKFVQREVNFVGGYEYETIVPDQGHPIDVFLGKWARYPSDAGLWVRTGQAKIGGTDLALNRDVSETNYWFYRIHYEGSAPEGEQIRGFFSILGLPGQLTLEQLAEAEKLSREFSAAFESYRRNF